MNSKIKSKSGLEGLSFEKSSSEKPSSEKNNGEKTTRKAKSGGKLRVTEVIDDTVQYVKSFLKDPQVASVTPTSLAVVTQILDRFDFGADQTIIEYGAGTGVFTVEILRRMTPGSRLLAFETNPGLVAILRKIDDPRLMVSDQSALDVLQVCAENGIHQADFILSGVPFTFLKKRDRTNLTRRSHQILGSGGEFVAYQASRVMKPVFESIFGNIETDSYLLNIPPLFLMVSRKR